MSAILQSIPAPQDTSAARVDTVRRISRDVAGPAAASVDRDGRFPHEAIDALKAEGLLSAFVPV